MGEPRGCPGQLLALSKEEVVRERVRLLDVCVLISVADTVESVCVDTSVVVVGLP